MSEAQEKAGRVGAATTPPAALELRGVTAGYRRTTVLRDVNLRVEKGTVLALLGPNGAGKTTLLRTVSGLLRTSAGKVLLADNDVTRLPPHLRAKRGLCLIPEGRGVFKRLTVRDNLRMYSPPWVDAASSADDVDVAVAAFPVLGQRLGKLAGSLSGGQQQMLALARTHLAKPDVVLLDEVSMGLAPKAIEEIFAFLHQLASTGVSVVLVEQYVQKALEMASDVVLLNHGEVAYSGPAAGLDEQAVAREYLGTAVESD